MKKYQLVALLAFTLSSTFATSAVHAADASAVLGACDRDPKCGYSGNKDNGDISGCSQHACFYCPADGSHQCYGVAAARKGGGKKGRPGTITIGGVKVGPPPPGVKVRPVKIGISKKPATVRNMNTQKMNSEKSDIGHETQHSSGGRHR